MISWPEIANLINARREHKANFVGNNLSFNCPFKKESSGSFLIDLFKGTYKCFDCLKKGEVNNLEIELADIEISNQQKKSKGKK